MDVRHKGGTLVGLFRRECPLLLWVNKISPNTTMVATSGGAIGVGGGGCDITAIKYIVDSKHSHRRIHQRVRFPGVKASIIGFFEGVFEHTRDIFVSSFPIC